MLTWGEEMAEVNEFKKSSKVQLIPWKVKFHNETYAFLNIDLFCIAYVTEQRLYQLLTMVDIGRTRTRTYINPYSPS